ncbi:hypothetical protein G9444_0066 [Rhodococcus erythropolis]|jgi:hypothetical protein|uniref:Uncharacterized protein n=1 Tax=Rhodococcus erythropolis TaxID=1833 RepID=A0A6G9CKG4_RHOER|nr:hypothetical protein [Rhodococcus erythropolis]QIP37310.1 hypothetical protein G9444_0066 [Rhodococcus erythropolis]
MSTTIEDTGTNPSTVKIDARTSVALVKRMDCMSFPSMMNMSFPSVMKAAGPGVPPILFACWQRRIASV